MKRIISVLLAVLLFACNLAGCEKQPQPIDDVKYVEDKGTLVVGVLDLKPFCYKDEGEWVGFDVDMARAFAGELGVDVEFKQIVWDNKVVELDDKNIDILLCGMAADDDAKDELTLSGGYLKTAQVTVVKADMADRYKTLKSLEKLKFSVESGSSSEAVSKEEKLDRLVVENQHTALYDVNAGVSDGCIVDIHFAGASVGDGNDYPDLECTVKLNSEKCVAAFRKGSDLADSFDKFVRTHREGGDTARLAEKYGIASSYLIK